MKDKKINWNTIGWRALQFFVILILNAGLIFFFIANVIPVNLVNKAGQPTNEVSYWDVLTIKYIAKQYKQLESMYHFYNKPLVYASIILGLYLSYLFIKMLYNNKKELQKQIHQEEQTNKIVNAINKRDERDVNKYL